jgi:[acyl-carrier-protein] S-malonyltransferase
LVATDALNFESGLKLVYQRAMAMQEACDLQESTMAAVLGLKDNEVEDICKSITNEIVVPANYNCPGQIVISGSIAGIDKAIEKLKEAGAKRAMKLNVNGAFHSPLMEPAKEKLSEVIKSTKFKSPICPVYQNVYAQAVTNPDIIKENLISQLTSPVRWTQTMQNMLANGMNEYIEVGPGKVLQGLLRKVDRRIDAFSAELIQE